MSIPTRPLFSLALSISLIGWGVWITSRQPDRKQAESSRSASDLQRGSLPVYSVELLRTFTAEHSPPAASDNPITSLSSDIFLTDQASIQILFEGQPLFESREPIPPHQRIFIERIPGVRRGRNEIFFLARLLPSDDPQLWQAMSGRIKVGDQIVAEEVYTSHPNSPLVYGTLVFEGIAADE